MKRWVSLVSVVAGLLIFASSAYAIDFSVGGFGGVSIPVVQDDAENGTVFGIKGRFPITAGLAVEPQIFFLKNGKYDVVFDDNPGFNETLDSWKATSIGANLVLGAARGQFNGVRPLFFGGFRLNMVELDSQDSESEFGFGAGIGLEIGLKQFSVEVRAAGEVFPQDGASRKNGLITAGVNMFFGP